MRPGGREISPEASPAACIDERRPWSEVPPGRGQIQAVGRTGLHSMDFWDFKKPGQSLGGCCNNFGCAVFHIFSIYIPTYVWVQLVQAWNVTLNSPQTFKGIILK